MDSPIQEATELVENLFQCAAMILNHSKISCNEQDQYITINNNEYKIYKNKYDLDFTVINSHTGELSVESSLYHCASYIAGCIICDEIKTFFETRHELNLTALARAMQKGDANG